MLACRHSLLYSSSALRGTNGLLPHPSVCKFGLSPEHLLPFFWTPVSLFSWIPSRLPLFPGQSYGLFGWSSSMKILLVRLLWTVPSITKIPLVSVTVTAWHLLDFKVDTWCTKIPWLTTMFTILSVACFSMLLLKSLNSMSRSTPQCYLKSLSWRDLEDALEPPCVFCYSESCLIMKLSLSTSSW